MRHADFCWTTISPPLFLLMLSICFYIQSFYHHKGIAILTLGMINDGRVLCEAVIINVGIEKLLFPRCSFRRAKSLLCHRVRCLVSQSTMSPRVADACTPNLPHHRLPQQLDTALYRLGHCSYKY